MGDLDSPAEDAPTLHPREDMAADLRELLRLIEAIHPDPFRGYDGRVALHARVEREIRRLPPEMTTEAFYRLAAPIVSELADAHSLLLPPDDRNPQTDARDRRLPVAFRVVGNALYVESVANEGLTELLGRRLLAVEDTPLPELVEQSRALRGSENRYGALDLTRGLLEKYDPLARLLDRTTPPDETTLTFDVAGEDRTYTLQPVQEGTPAAELERTLPYPSGTGPRYRVYYDGDVAVFAPGNLSDYRESLEAKHAAAAANAPELAAEAYDRQVGGSPPADVEERIAALPSMTETLESMLMELATTGTDTLIVDLRDNPGGDSQFVFHLAYALRGWDGIARATEQIKVLRRRTDAYQQRYGDAGSMPGSPEDGPRNPKDYDFTGYFDLPADEAGVDRVALVRQRLDRSPTATAFLNRVDETGIYAPDRLIVVTSAGTMSSAFAGAAQLTSLGADVVGVPPGQAPVSFGEHVERTLPNTGLTLRLAGSMYHWLDDPGGRVLEPASELTPARFEQCDTAADAGLRLAFEYAGYEPPGSDPDVCPER